MIESDPSDQTIHGTLVSYHAPASKGRIALLYESQTLWLDQKRIAALFGVAVHTINYHVKEIYATGELTPATTLRKIRRVQIEGKRPVSREISFYCLDVLISVGYRVNSCRATLFRIWATQTLRNLVGNGICFVNYCFEQFASPLAPRHAP